MRQFQNDGVSDATQPPTSLWSGDVGDERIRFVQRYERRLCEGFARLVSLSRASPTARDGALRVLKTELARARVVANRIVCAPTYPADERTDDATAHTSIPRSAYTREGLEHLKSTVEEALVTFSRLTAAVEHYRRGWIALEPQDVDCAPVPITLAYLGEAIGPEY